MPAAQVEPTAGQRNVGVPLRVKGLKLGRDPHRGGCTSDSGQGNRAGLTRPEAQVEAREILIQSDRDQSFG